MGFGFRASYFGYRASGFWSRVSGLGFLVSGFGFLVSGFGFREPGFGFRVSGFGFWVWFRISGFWFRISGFGFRASGLRFRVPVFCFGFRDSGFAFRASNLGFRVSGFETRVERRRESSLQRVDLLRLRSPEGRDPDVEDAAARRREARPVARPPRGVVARAAMARAGQASPEAAPRRVEARAAYLQGEIGILLPNNQRQHRTSHAPKDVLPLCICANYCDPWQPLLRAFPGWIQSPSHTFTNSHFQFSTSFRAQISEQGLAKYL